MKYSRVVTAAVSRSASMCNRSVLLTSHRCAVITYFADLLLALLAVAVVSLLSALALALLSAAPARADIAPSFWCVAPNVGRRENYVGPSPIAIVDEDVKVFIRRGSQYGGDNCQTIRTLLLKNQGNKTYTEQLYVPAESYYVGETADNLRVKINGKVAKVDAIPKSLDMHTGFPSKYYIVRSDGWPMKFAPGEVIKLEVSTTSSSVWPHGRRLWVPSEWDDEKEKALVDFEPETVAFACSYNNEWRAPNSRQRVTFILLEGLTIDNVASMDPRLPAASFHTLVWETHGAGTIRDTLTLNIRLNITNKELAARYERLHAKHPKNSTIVAKLGAVYESQALYGKQLKLYRDFMVAHPVRPKEQFGYGGFWDFREAWVMYTERTHNEQDALVVAPILAKVLGSKAEDWNQTPATMRWYKRYVERNKNKKLAQN